MTTRHAELIPAEDLAQVAGDVLGAFLGLPVTEAVQDGAPELTGVVRISGAFTGTVACGVTREFATFCAARMLDVDQATVADEELFDTLGEITNMVGGLVKALLSEPSTLSLPAVAPGDGPAHERKGVVGTVDLRCCGDVLRVTVREGAPS